MLTSELFDAFADLSNTRLVRPTYLDVGSVIDGRGEARAGVDNDITMSSLG